MKQYLFLLMVATGVVSCQSDPFAEERPTGGRYPEQIISISPHAENEEELSTRGTPVANEQQMTDLGVFCAYTGLQDWTAAATPGKMFNNHLLHNPVNGRWEYSGSPVSWSATTSNDRYSFFAYAPYATAQNGIVVQGNASTAGIPSIVYTVPTDVTAQPDLMQAVPSYNLRPSNSMVALHMKHALTCIGFSAVGGGERVVSVTISGVVNQGKLTLDGSGIWTNLGASTFSLSAGINTNIVLSATPQNILTGNGYLMMIPQRLTNATLTIVLDNSVTKTFPLNTQLDWVAGKKIQYIVATNLTVKGTADRITVKDGKLSITNDPNDKGLFFKCGGVVGVAGIPSLFSIPFNPTVGISIGRFGMDSNTPPAVPGITKNDVNMAVSNVSQNNYHNLVNVHLGKGDPCRLIGMTADEIRAFGNDAALYAREAALKNSGVGGWRLPTNIEANAFAGITGIHTTSDHWWNLGISIYGNPKVAGGEFPVRNTSGVSTFLPASGIIDAYSETYSSYNTDGRYWQGDVEDFGYHLEFNPSGFYVNGKSVYTHGMSIRCVR